MHQDSAHPVMDSIVDAFGRSAELSTATGLKHCLGPGSGLVSTWLSALETLLPVSWSLLVWEGGVSR